MNSPVGPALVQLLRQGLKSLQDDVKRMSSECDKEKSKVQSELQNFVNVLDGMEQRMERLEIRQQTTESEIGDVKDRMSAVEDTMYKREGNLKATMYIRDVKYFYLTLNSPSILPRLPFYGTRCAFIQVREYSFWCMKSIKCASVISPL